MVLVDCNSMRVLIFEYLSLFFSPITKISDSFKMTHYLHLTKFSFFASQLKGFLAPFYTLEHI